ncbi:MAG: DUF4382 domain-containing protein [Dehalococcoidia bacterium]
MKKGLLIATVLAVLAILVASCRGLPPTQPATGEPGATSPATPSATGTATISPEPSPAPAAEAGNFKFLISDEENAIGDFESLLVTITEIGVHKVGGESSGWLDLPLDNLDPPDVELTNLVGDPAVEIWSGTIPVGQYTKVFIHVDTISFVLKSGGSADVMLPSDKLQISKPFVVTEDNNPANPVEFVYDVTVKKAGRSGKYLILPQIGQSGADQPFDLVDTTPPTVLSVTTLDRDADGKVDAATVVFSEAIDDATFVAGDWTLGGVTVEAIDSLITPDDDTLQLQINTDANEVTGTDAKDVVYTPGTAADLTGNLLAAVASADIVEDDGAVPQVDTIVTATTTTIDATFSEDLDGVTVVDTDFNVSDNSVSAASEDSPGVVTLTLGTAIDPDATPDVTYTQGTLADPSGNLVDSLGPTAATDGISPELLSATWTDVDSSTTINANDSLAFEFSEPIDQSTITDSNIDTVLPIVGTGSTYGTSLSLSWDVGGTVLTVTLGTGVDVATGDTVNPTDSVTDASGNADATTGDGPAIS